MCQVSDSTDKRSTRNALCLQSDVGEVFSERLYGSWPGPTGIPPPLKVSCLFALPSLPPLMPKGYLPYSSAEVWGLRPSPGDRSQSGWVWGLAQAAQASLVCPGSAGRCNEPRTWCSSSPPTAPWHCPWPGPHSPRGCTLKEREGTPLCGAGAMPRRSLTPVGHHHQRGPLCGDTVCEVGAQVERKGGSVLTLCLLL